MMFTRLFDFKRRIIIVWGVLVILAGLTIFLLVNSKSGLLKVKDEIILVEYGQSVPTEPKYYLDLKELNTSDKNDVLENTKLKSNVKNEIEIIDNIDGTKNEKDKGYASVGTYRIILKYKKEIKEVKVIVKDTVKPELVVPENVEIFLGTDLNTFDFKKLMQATDLARLNDYIIDTSLVDINNIGEYIVKVSVEDINKNKSEKEFKVTIISPPANDEEVIQEVVTNDDGSISVKAVTKKKSVVSNDKSSTSSSPSKPSNNKPINNPDMGSESTGNNSSMNTDKNDSNSSKNDSNENNGHYETFYCCLDHFSDTYGKYHTLQELINAGHFTGGCGSNNYSYGEEWVRY